MSGRNGSADSFDEFLSASKNDNEADEKKPTKSAVAALIKSQPVLHHRRTPSESNASRNSQKLPLTTNTKSKLIEPSPLPTTYDSDFDNNASADEKKKYRSLSPSKQRSPDTSRRNSDSRLKNSHSLMKTNTRRKERLLPYIRPKNRTKRLQKEAINEVRQRIQSAQNEKLNQLQSHLADLHRQLENERIENKTLRTIQKREEKALRKYEDQEYDIHKVARDYTCEIDETTKKIYEEKEIQMTLKKEMEERDKQLRQQRKRIQFYEKLADEEAELDDSDQLREKLKETDRKLKKYEEKIANEEKRIKTLEKMYSQEIHQELLKQRDLKQELQNHAKKYADLQHRYEEKSRQVGTMHIYIQRGGRRPSNSSSIDLAKARSLQSLEDTSPRFREKILEYDKRLRDQNKLKPKPKLRPIPTNPPPKPARKKYVPSIVLKPKLKPIKTLAVPVQPEKPPVIEVEKVAPWDLFNAPSIKPVEHPPLKRKPPVRRLSTPKSIDEEKSEIEDQIVITPVHPKPSPTPTKMIHRSEEYIYQLPVRKRSPSPSPSPSPPPPEPKFAPSGTSITASLFKPTEPKPLPTRNFDEKWSDIFDTNKQEDVTKDDLLSKLISDEQEERKVIPSTKPSPPSSQRPSMIMFEPSSISTNGNQKKTPSRITTTNVYDFDQAVINLHEGKPVTTPTKTSVDPFESLFETNTTKSTHHMNNRDDTFTTAQVQPDPFSSLFTHSSTAADTSTSIKPNLRSIPTPNDKLQRPKIVTNAPRPVPNRTLIEDIDEIVL